MRTWSFALLVVVALPSVVDADVRMPGNRPFSTAPKPHPKIRNRPDIVYLAYENATLRELPGNKSPAVQLDAPIKFMQEFAWSAEYDTAQLPGGDPAKSERWRLLVTLNEAGDRVAKNVGWVPTKYLVRGEHALKDPTYKLELKGLIVNPPEVFAKDRKAGAPSGLAPVRLAPRPGARTVQPFSLYQLFFVYGEAEGHVLLGASPAFDPALTPPDRAIYGWVPKERVCVWNTREALEWRADTTLPTAKPRRTQRGFIYKTVQGAYNARDGGPPEVGIQFAEVFTPPNGVRSRATGELEFPGNVSLPWPHDRMRYPIVDWPADVPQPRDTGDNRLYRVGGVGDFHAGSTTVDQARVEELQKYLGVCQLQAGRTEIVFVVDDTGSMNVWFPEVAKVVEDIIALAKKDRTRQVFIAVTYFNDTDNGTDQPNPTPVVVGKLTDARSPEGEAIAKELRVHQAKSGGDPLEMSFLGLKEGIEGAGFSPTARKMVVLLTDMGDKTADKNAKLSPGYPHEADIARLLVPEAASPIEFWPIQVIDPERDMNPGDARSMRTQMKAILAERAKLIREQFKGQICPGEYRNLDLTDPAQVKTAAERQLQERQRAKLREDLMKQYAELKRRADEFKRGVEDAGGGRWSNANSAVGLEIEGLLLQQGFTPAELKALHTQKGVQIFDYGYVWLKPPGDRGRGQPEQVRTRLLLSGDEIEKMVKLLDKLDPWADTQSGQLTVKNLLRRVVLNMAGEIDLSPSKLEFVSFEEVVRKGLGLPIYSALLRRKLGGIKDQGAEAELSREDLAEILLKRDRLKDILAGVRHEYERREIVRAGFKDVRWVQKAGDPRQPPPKQQRAFRLGRTGTERSEWYWIDVEEEWP